ncbi:MAG TPA: nuclease-related domain-containing protein [Thermomicrobiales bacterium]|nr:nuclease-related domain-containing protein [Thermomicrobiales bacterium]
MPARSGYLRAERRRSRRRAALLVLLGALALGAVLLPGISTHLPPIAAAPAAAVTLVAAWASFALAGRARRRARRFAAGERGEDALAAALARDLPDDYTLYRNLRLPGYRADLDAVLLGPPGVVVLENKAYRGEFVLYHDRWYRADPDGDLRPWRASPTCQAADNAARLAAWLMRQGLGGVPVHPLVVLSSGAVREERRRPATPVVPLTEAARAVMALPRARRPGRRDRRACARALDALQEGADE